MRLGLLTLASLLPALALAQAQQPPPDQAPPPGAPSAEEQQRAEKEIIDSFVGKDNFRLEGTAAMVDAEQGAVLINREDMPPAVLIVPQPATVEINGKPGSLTDVQPGAEVRATFNLAQQYPVALKLEVKQQAEAPPVTPTPPARPGTPAPTE